MGNLETRSSLSEAMRLMRAGDLSGATAAIKRGLQGGHAAQPLVAPDAARFIAGHHAGPAGERRYKLFIPGAYRGQPLPLVVMLHGCTQSADDFATGTRMNALAEERGCFVVYPEQSRNANASKCWNWFNASDQRPHSGEPAIIAALVRELSEKYSIDAARVFIAGLSAGGAMAVILGATHPGLFAAVGVHSGLPYRAAHDLPSGLAAMRGASGAGASVGQGAIPTIVFHGDRDTTVHPGNAEQVALQAAGPCACDAARDTTVAGEAAGQRAHTRRVFRDGDGRVLVESWLVHGAAHAWCGGDARGTHTDPRGPDASREMMRFFFARG